MKKKIKNIMNSRFVRFGLVGICNTFLGIIVMFVSYDVLSLGYWASTSLGYLLGGMFSYWANKPYSFRNKDKNLLQVCKYVMNLIICYLMAYGVAQRLIWWTFSFFTDKVRDNLAMCVGLGLYTLLNYVGQSKWVFRRRD